MTYASPAALAETVEVRVSDPMVSVRFLRDLDGDEYQAYLDEMVRIMKTEFRGARRSVVLDCTAWIASEAAMRRMQAEWMDEHRVLLQKTTVAMGLVIDGGLMRGALRAVFWLTPSPLPHKVFKNAADAEAWALEAFASQSAAGTERPSP